MTTLLQVASANSNLQGPGAHRPGPKYWDATVGPMGPFRILILKRVRISGIAIYQELRSSHAITEGPCAYLVLNSAGGPGTTSWYLDLTQLVRDLVRLKLYAVLRRYQEEVFYIYIYIYMLLRGAVHL